MKSDLFTAPAQYIVILAMAAVPLLIIETGAWQSIYGSIILAVTLFGAVALPWRVNLTESLRLIGMLLLLVVPIVTSILVNQPEDSHVVNIGMLACYAILASVLFSEPRDRSFSRFFLLVSVTQGVAVVLTLNTLLVDSDSFLDLFGQGISRQAFEFAPGNSDIFSGLFGQGAPRLDSEFDEIMNPNYIGSICVLIVFAALGLKSVIQRVVILVLGLALCAAVSSRGGMLGVVAAFGTAELFLLAASGRRRFIPNIILYIGIVVLVLLGGIFYSLHPDEIADFILDKILLINDDERGLGSGATGRFDLWRMAFDIWRDHPLFGMGYEQASAYIGFGLGAHNMILEILADLGVFGLLGFLSFSAAVAWNARALWRSGQRLAAIYVATMLIVYYVYGVFEGRAINVGNPLSAAFFLVTFASFGIARRLPTP